MTRARTGAGGDSPFEMRGEGRGEAFVLSLCGSCTMSDAALLGQRIMEVAESPAKVLIVELSGLEFIESTNLGKIVAGYLRLRKRGGDLRLVAPQPEIRHLLDLTRLSTLFGVYNTIDDAMPNGGN